MAIIYTDNVLPETSGVGENLNLGTTGDTVTLPAGVTLKTNKIADAGGNNVITSDGSGNLTVNADKSGNIVLLNSTTATNQAAVNLTSSITGFNTTYKTYIIRLIDLRPTSPSGGNTLLWNGSTDAGSTYAVNHLNTFIRQYRGATGSGNGGSGATAYNNTFRHELGTGDSEISTADNDNATDCWNGEIYLYNPGSTTYWTNFSFSILGMYVDGSGTSSYWEFGSGYFAVTADIDAVTFKMNSGNLSGTIQLYGMG